jgi:predicted amidohydrolase YtcJ
MTTPDHVVEAMTIEGDKITWTGSNADAPADAIDLEGRVVLPGFVDGHMHFLHVGVKKLRPNLLQAPSRDAAVAIIKDWLQENPGADGVIAEGWDEGLWQDQRHPTVAELDAITDRPLVFRRVCGHISIANSTALLLVRAEWDDKRVNLATGLLLEEPSLYLNRVMPVSAQALDEAVIAACDEAIQLGVTTVGDYSQLPYRQALLRAAARGTLTVRTSSSIYTEDLRSEIQNSFKTGTRHSQFLQDGGVKVFLDGSLGGHTALLRDNYCDDEQCGTAIWTPEEIVEHFHVADQNGVQIHAHAIGDAAIDLGLDGFETLPPATDDLRHRFEHYELPHDDAIARTMEAGITCCSQPNFVGEWSSKGGMYEDRLGQRYEMNNRFSTYLKAGVQLCFGSDGMPFGPLYGLNCALNHPITCERVSVEEALWLYTSAAGRSLHWQTGQLKPGYFADFIVLDQTELDNAPLEWKFFQVTIGGQIASSGLSKNA